MASPKRTKAQRHEDLAKTAALYVRGISQYRIAEIIGVTRTQIQYDIKEIEANWRNSAIMAIDDRKARELGRIDELERTYWEAWENSLKDRVITSIDTERTRPRQTDEEGAESRQDTTARLIKESIRTEQLLGDPRYLQGIQNCIERRCKILGLDAPVKVAPTDPTGENEYAPDTTNESRASRILAILGQATAKRVGLAADGTEAASTPEAE